MAGFRQPQTHTVMGSSSALRRSAQLYLNDQLSNHAWQPAYPYAYSAHFWVAPPASYSYRSPHLEVRAYRGVGSGFQGPGMVSQGLPIWGDRLSRLATLKLGLARIVTTIARSIRG